MIRRDWLRGVLGLGVGAQATARSASENIVALIAQTAAGGDVTGGTATRGLPALAPAKPLPPLYVYQAPTDPIATSKVETFRRCLEELQINGVAIVSREQQFHWVDDELVQIYKAEIQVVEKSPL